MSESPTFRAQAVLFDLDGVLVDSEASIKRAWRAWCDRLGCDWSAVEPHVSGRHGVDTVSAVLPEVDDEDVQAHADWVNDRQVDDVAELRAIPGMAGFVRALPRWCVVTSCPDRLARARLRAVGLSPPPVLITAERVARGKPHPDSYLLGANGVGVPPADCLVVEDTPSGVAAARAADMTVIAVRTTHDAAALRDADAVVADGTQLSVVEVAGDVVAVAALERVA